MATATQINRVRRVIEQDAYDAQNRVRRAWNEADSALREQKSTLESRCCDLRDKRIKVAENALAAKLAAVILKTGVETASPKKVTEWMYEQIRCCETKEKVSDNGRYERYIVRSDSSKAELDLTKQVKVKQTALDKMRNEYDAAAENVKIETRNLLRNIDLYGIDDKMVKMIEAFVAKLAKVGS